MEISVSPKMFHRVYDVAVLKKSKDLAALEGQAAVGLIESAGQVSQAAAKASKVTAPDPTGTGSLINLYA